MINDLVDCKTQFPFCVFPLQFSELGFASVNTSGLTLPNFLSTPAFKDTLNELIKQWGICEATFTGLVMAQHTDPKEEFCGILENLIHVTNQLLQQVFKNEPIDGNSRRSFEVDVTKYI